jgi:hypothetical protein
MTLRQVAGGARRMVVGATAAALIVTGVSLLVFRDVASITLAVVTLWLGIGVGWTAVARRHRETDRGA